MGYPALCFSGRKPPSSPLCPGGNTVKCAFKRGITSYPDQKVSDVLVRSAEQLMTEMRVATLIEESMSGLPGEIPIYCYPWPILTRSQRMPPRATLPTTTKGAQSQSTFHSPNADQAQAQTNRPPRCTGLQSSSGVDTQCKLFGQGNLKTQVLISIGSSFRLRCRLATLSVLCTHLLLEALGALRHGFRWVIFVQKISIPLLVDCALNVAGVAKQNSDLSFFHEISTIKLDDEQADRDLGKVNRLEDYQLGAFDV